MEQLQPQTTFCPASNLKGKRILVTGVSAGIGVETARSLAAHGAQVVGAARDLNKAKAATEQVRKDAAANGGSFELVELDLANLKSVRACADRIAGERRTVRRGHRQCRSDGHTVRPHRRWLRNAVRDESPGPLCPGQPDCVAYSDGGRLINVSSAGHRYSNVDLVDPNFERTPYDPIVAYGRSKTANILFAVAFDKRHRDRGVRAAAVHPGGIQTELGRYQDPGRIEKMIDQINQQRAAQGKGPFQWKTIPQGAATSVWAAVVAPATRSAANTARTATSATSCRTTLPVAISEGVRGYAIDPNNAEALWKKSEEMVGESF